MSIRSDITKDDGWFRLERKVIAITVTDAAGAALNLSALTLAWRVLREVGSTKVYLTKTTGIFITGAGSNVANIPIDPDGPSLDYATLPAGIHYHELWDVDNDLLLSYGDAYLHGSRGP